MESTVPCHAHSPGANELRLPEGTRSGIQAENYRRHGQLLNSRTAELQLIDAEGADNHEFAELRNC